MTRRLFKTAALAAVVALPAAAGFAQTTSAPQNQAQPPSERRMGRGLGGRRDGRNPMRDERGERQMLRRLNLTDAQRQQVRDIEARYAQTFRPQREELRKLVEVRRGGGTLTPEQQARAKQLREEMRANAEKMRAEIQNVLTPEQRQQIQQGRDERKQRREQFRERRQQRRNNNNPPPAGDANGVQ